MGTFEIQFLAIVDFDFWEEKMIDFEIEKQVVIKGVNRGDLAP